MANKTVCRQPARPLSPLIFVIERQIIPVSQSIEKYNNKFPSNQYKSFVGRETTNIFPWLVYE